MLLKISLGRKLTVLYILSTLFILVVFGLFSIPIIVQYLHLHDSSISQLSIYCFKVLVISLLVGASIVGLLSIIITRRGLKSISALVMQVNSVEQDTLSLRIVSDGFPLEVMELSQKFNNMLDRLEESFSQLDQFSSDIAHEFRNPLQNLIGETELVLCQDAGEDELRDVLVSNMEEYHHLNRLIDKLLFLAKTKQGMLLAQKRMVVATKAIQSVCDLYHAKCEAENIALRVEGEAHQVYVDPTMFKQLINNVLVNAIKYTGKGGEIVIRVAQDTQDCVTIIVQDSGVGVEAHHLPKIFERFYRVDPSRNTLTGGAGLGLAICKSIVELHQGKITLNSVKDQGTTVMFTLPTSL